MTKIREYRQRAHLTMKELGALVGVSESAIGLWESGKRKPNYEKMLQVSEALGCSISDLVDDGAPANEEYMPEITMIARAGARMTPEKRADMLKILKTIYPEEFEL